MRPLPFPQTIELERGEAFQLYMAVATVWQNATQAVRQEPPQPLELGLLLALPLMNRLGKRLHKVCESDACQVGKPRRKPRAFHLSCEEVAVVTRHVLPVADLLARPVLGKVQQKSLNLAQYISF